MARASAWPPNRPLQWDSCALATPGPAMPPRLTSPRLRRAPAILRVSVPAGRWPTFSRKPGLPEPLIPPTPLILNQVMPSRRPRTLAGRPRRLTVPAAPGVRMFPRTRWNLTIPGAQARMTRPAVRVAAPAVRVAVRAVRVAVRAAPVTVPPAFLSRHRAGLRLPAGDRPGCRCRRPARLAFGCGAPTASARPRTRPGPRSPGSPCSRRSSWWPGSSWACRCC